MVNIFTVDVEDYFHPTEVAAEVKSWSTHQSRIEVGVNILLDLLAERNQHGTFFVLGWVADYHAPLVRQIVRAGHEIGCHSYHHRLVYELTPEEFRKDTRRAVAAIENACGVTPKLYRAPSYSIVDKSFWALEILAELGFTHDSSIYPIKHDRYGMPGFARHAHTIATASGPIIEVPIASVRLSFNRVTPVGGGAYLRLFPYRYTAAGIRVMNERESQPACIYTHPWELDSHQPRNALGLVSRLRTYTGLRTMEMKLRRLCREFRFSTMSAVHPTRLISESPLLGEESKSFGPAVIG